MVEMSPWPQWPLLRLLRCIIALLYWLPWWFLHKVQTNSVFGCSWKPLISRASWSCLCHFPSAHSARYCGQRKLIADFAPHSVLCGCSMESELVCSSLRCHSACGVCSQPLYIFPSSDFEAHSTYEPTAPSIYLWSGKALSEWEELLAIYDAESFK